MTPQRYHALQALGFVWNVWDARWMEQYQGLEEFCRMKGPGAKPHYKHDARVYSWLKNQTRQYRLRQEGAENHNMTDERLQLLQDLGYFLEVDTHK